MTDPITAVNKRHRRLKLATTLNSGKYAQTEGTLGRKDPDTADESYCCLGVATIIAPEVHPEAYSHLFTTFDSLGALRVISGSGTGTELSKNSGCLLPYTRDLYGFNNDYGGFHYPTLPQHLQDDLKPYRLEGRSGLSLATCNDTYVPFHLIARIIMEQPAGLVSDGALSALPEDINATLRSEIIALWTTALRSNLYEQGRNGFLCQTNTPSPRYCCLGVLMEELSKTFTNIIREPEPQNGGIVYGVPGDSRIATLTEAIWEGLQLNDSPLIQMNDGPDARTFPEIADYIERGSN